MTRTVEVEEREEQSLRVRRLGIEEVVIGLELYLPISFARARARYPPRRP